jgi:hypothetical protein
MHHRRTVPRLLLLLLLLPGLSQAVTRYVANGGSGNCSTGQNINTPLGANLQTALSCMSAGDRLELRQGNYTWPDTNSFTVPSGTSFSNAITIASFAGETATFLSLGFGGASNGVSYVIFDRITIDHQNAGGDAYFIGYGAHHIRFQNGEVKNSYGQGMHIDGTGSDPGGNEILTSAIHDIGSPGSGNQEHGMYITAPSTVIDGNDIYNVRAFGIHVYSGYVGIDATNSIIRNNRVHGCNIEGGSGAGAVILSHGDNILFYNNLVYNNGGGGSGAVWVYSNVNNTKLYNNTIYGNANDPGIHVFSGVPNTIINTIIRNNILSNNSGSMQDDGSGTTCSNNLNATTSCQSSGTTDPQFTDAANGDFHASSSSVVGQGVNLSSVFTTDFAGNTRPSSAPWALGAYEAPG